VIGCEKNEKLNKERMMLLVSNEIMKRWCRKYRRRTCCGDLESHAIL